MNTMQLQQPAPRIPTRPAALQIAHAADRCVKWLRAQGFEVLAVQAAHLYRNPRITVRACPLCERLEGAVHRYDRTTHNGAKIERRYWVAIRFGCEVRWEEARHVAG